MLNLVINAIEAIEGEGHVKVCIKRRGHQTGDSLKDEAIVEVKDTGRGIAQADLARIFNPFYTTRAGGTGLGLPAVRRIARVHGGRVEVHSLPGHGSTFTLVLPLSRQP